VSVRAQQENSVSVGKTMLPSSLTSLGQHPPPNLGLVFGGLAAQFPGISAPDPHSRPERSVAVGGHEVAPDHHLLHVPFAAFGPAGSYLRPVYIAERNEVLAQWAVQSRKGNKTTSLIRATGCTRSCRV